jgi:hypothetical protein
MELFFAKIGETIIPSYDFNHKLLVSREVFARDKVKFRISMETNNITATRKSSSDMKGISV